MAVAAALEKVLATGCNTETLTDLPRELQMYSKDMNVPNLTIRLKMLPDLLLAYNENNPATAITVLSRFLVPIGI